MMKFGRRVKQKAYLFTLISLFLSFFAAFAGFLAYDPLKRGEPEYEFWLIAILLAALTLFCIKRAIFLFKTEEPTKIYRLGERWIDSLQNRKSPVSDKDNDRD